METSMSFDDEVDAMKKELKAKRLDPESVIKATQDLEDKLVERLDSKRIKYEYDFDDEDGPKVGIYYTKGQFQIGTAWVHGDGSVAFASENEYFPPLVAYDSEEEFFKEARNFLKEGLAAFELDEEEDAYEA
jgi:hypothetical protein